MKQILLGWPIPRHPADSHPMAPLPGHMRNLLFAFFKSQETSASIVTSASKESSGTTVMCPVTDSWASNEPILQDDSSQDPRADCAVTTLLGSFTSNFRVTSGAGSGDSLVNREVDPQFLPGSHRGARCIENQRQVRVGNPRSCGHGSRGRYRRGVWELQLGRAWESRSVQA